MALATALTVVLVTGRASAQQVLLQPAGSAGPDPFTGSVAKATPSATPSAASTGPSGLHTVSGSTVGLYGGTERASSCDVAQLIDFLTTHPDKGGAWAAVEGISQADIPAYLRSLTAVLLRTDTRVTNHGFRGGVATSFQAVLQTGTAVLVDTRGVPRARCSCGNPLLPPVAETTETFTGTSWSSFQPGNLVVIVPAVTQVTVIVLFDPDSGGWFARPPGGTGDDDRSVPPPVPAGTTSGTPASGSTSPNASTSGSASPCVSPPGSAPPPDSASATDTGCPTTPVSSAPSSVGPSSASTSTEQPPTSASTAPSTSAPSAPGSS